MKNKSDRFQEIKVFSKIKSFHRIKEDICQNYYYLGKFVIFPLCHASGLPMSTVHYHQSSTIFYLALPNVLYTARRYASLSIP
jgi:hypothetical protein